MADDEGAAYWESVYGQPIHVYSRPSHSSHSHPSNGQLERMTDDEYASYVRQKMWEKTHAGLLEARAAERERGGGAREGEGEGGGEKEFAARLKEERVRWHPDKMQQRLGGKVDEKVMRDVTAIFQVVDALWNDTRKNGG
ncbi:hypothetical protein N0V88_002004 [Collariella sp. IMI 366227]|nr:hypothetical protein N0V88_002004 [Collariella sp. IMI 366227]